MKQNQTSLLPRLDDIFANAFDSVLSRQENAESIRDSLGKHASGLPTGLNHKIIIRSRVWQRESSGAHVIYANTITAIHNEPPKKNEKSGRLYFQNYAGYSGRVHNQLEACTACAGTGADFHVNATKKSNSFRPSHQESAALQEILRSVFLGKDLRAAILKVQGEARSGLDCAWNLIFLSEYSNPSDARNRTLQLLLKIGFPLSKPGPKSVEIFLGSEPEFGIAQICSTCKGETTVSKISGTSRRR